MSRQLLPSSPAACSTKHSFGADVIPKAQAHFDAEGILAAVHAQDVGLRVTTNNPTRFKQIMYKAAARAALRLHIYSFPRQPNSFALLKEARPNLKEQTDAAQ